VDQNVYQPVVADKFIVIPGHEIDKMVTEDNASPSTESGRRGVTIKVTENNLVLGRAQDALGGPPVPTSPPS
jgi:hypothetical protein